MVYGMVFNYFLRHSPNGEPCTRYIYFKSTRCLLLVSLVFWDFFSLSPSSSAALRVASVRAGNLFIYIPSGMYQVYIYVCVRTDQAC